VSSIPKTTAALLSLFALALIGGCIRHPNSRYRYEQPREISAARELVNDERPDVEPLPELPGDRLVSSSTGPTTSRYMDTQPTNFRPTRIVMRVGDRGLVRRQWSLAVCPRPSGDVLAGPTYWPTVDKAVQRPNKDNVWMEPLEFVYNAALLPYRAIRTPPDSKMVYSPSGGIGWRNVEQSGVIFQERE
jgi:hypothetical protein